MKWIRLLLILFPVCLSLQDYTSENSSSSGHRNLIIIQDHYTESNKRLSPCTVALLRALQAEIAPILVSSSVWYNACCYIECHGNEHFLKPRLKKWEVYKVNKHLYLAVPKGYKEFINSCCEDATWFVQKTGNAESSNNVDDIKIGLKLSQLEKIEKPFECSTGQAAKNTFRRVGAFFTGTKPDITVEHLKQVLITNDDMPHGCKSPPLDIFLVGHGTCNEKKKSKQFMLAGFTLDDFRSFLKFLNDNLNTRLLIYQTCYAGGKLLKIPYTTAGKADLYNFDIVSCCTTNSPASIIYNPFSQNNLDFQKIFIKLDDSTNVSIQERVAAYMPINTDSVSKRIIENIPFLRPAGSNDFVLCDGDHSGSVVLYDGTSQEIVLDSKQVFITKGNLRNVSIDMKNTPTAIIESGGGDITIERLNAPDQTLDQIILYCFSPVTMPGCPLSAVYIQELICKKSKEDTKSKSFKHVTISSYRISRRSSCEQDLSINGNCSRMLGLRKNITYQDQQKVFIQSYKPQRKSNFSDFFSFLWSTANIAQVGVGACMGSALSIASIPTSLASLASGSGSSGRSSIKRKKNWSISTPKILSSKNAFKYLEQFTKLEQEV